MWLGHSLTLPGESGRLDYRYAQVCEDMSGWWWARDCLVLAVADGLHSKLRAADASNLAIALARINTIGRSLLTGESPRARLNSLTHVFQKIRSDFMLRIAGEPDRDQWRTTFTILAVASRREMFFCSIGDSIILLRTGESASLAASTLLPAQTILRSPDNSTGTWSISDPIEHCVSRAVLLPECTGVVLSTDGLERMVNTSSDHRWTHQPLFGFVLQLLEKQDLAGIATGLAQPVVRSLKGDDVGIAVAAWRET